jgi:hypothetical protein
VETGSVLPTKKLCKLDATHSGVKRENGKVRSGARFRAESLLHKPSAGTIFHHPGIQVEGLLLSTQLLLLNESKIDPEILTSLREIEALAIRMRTMLREV